MTDTAILYSVLVPVAVIGGLARGFAGFGGPLIMIPVMSLLKPPAAAVAMMMWIDLFANVRLLPDARNDASVAVIAPLTLGTLLAIPAGLWLLVTIDPVIMKRTICVAVFVAASAMAWGWRFCGQVGRLVYTGVGLAAGLILGATGLAVTAALFLNAGHQTSRQARANYIVWIFIGTTVLIALFAYRGTLAFVDAPLVAILTATYVIATTLGARLHHRADDVFVRRIVLGLLLATATTGMIL